MNLNLTAGIYPLRFLKIELIEEDQVEEVEEIGTDEAVVETRIVEDLVLKEPMRMPVILKEEEDLMTTDQNLKVEVEEEKINRNKEVQGVNDVVEVKLTLNLNFANP